MTRKAVTEVVRLGEDAWLDLDELCQACGVDSAWVLRLVDEDLVQPMLTEQSWRFGGDELARVRRINRLQRDFDASLTSVAVMLDLLDEIDRLRTLMLRAGLATPER